ncbi:MAG TPA: metallophosphoesterase family protein [Planctomycetota bacterium]|nr:metallophosphoesterase family protein [Planctomycetota bacterium]
MAVALISDIHSNQEALVRVLDDIRSQGINEIYCLGDLVGYGPDPVFVVERAMEWPVVLMGNHDEAVLKEAYGFNPVAKAAVAWTRDQLRPGLLSGRGKKERWKFLQNLKLTHEVNGALLVHGSPRDPTMEYVLRSDCSDLAGGVPEKIRDIFSRFARLCFAGHTHDPGVITEDSRFISPKECDHVFTFESGKKYFVNIGSVGQPRDGDTRACYAVWDGDTVRWRRVEYDYRATMQKIFGTPQLDPRAGERLAQGR